MHLFWSVKVVVGKRIVRIVMRILRCTLSPTLTYIATTVAQFIACQTTALSVSKRASKL